MPWAAPPPPSPEQLKKFSADYDRRFGWSAMGMERAAAATRTLLRSDSAEADDAAAHYVWHVAKWGSLRPFAEEKALLLGRAFRRHVENRRPPHTLDARLDLWTELCEALGTALGPRRSGGLRRQHSWASKALAWYWPKHFPCVDANVRRSLQLKADDLEANRAAFAAVLVYAEEESIKEMAELQPYGPRSPLRLVDKVLWLHYKDHQASHSNCRACRRRGRAS